jgi:hypothetical protein
MNFIVRQIIRLFFFMIWSLGATIFFGAMHHYLARGEFLYLATLCFPILAILFGFSALLYNRSRALQPGPAQRRSLYAAERALQATVLFILGLASGAIIATIMSQLKLSVQPPEAATYLLLIFLVPILLILNSFSAFFFSFRAISHGMVRLVSTRELAKKLKQL